MGTSSIYHGPTKNNPLLPSDYEDEKPNQENNTTNEPIVTWKTVKTDFTKYINGKSGSSSRNGGSIKNVAKQY